jgi:hypothetical protein
MVGRKALAAFTPSHAANDQAKASQVLAVEIAALERDVPKVLEEWLNCLLGRQSLIKGLAR